MTRRPFVKVPAADRNDILDVIGAYTVLYDENRIDELTELFADNVLVEPNLGPDGPAPVQGKNKARDFYETARNQAREEGTQTRHYSTNPLFLSFDGSRCELRANMLYAEFGESAQLKLVGHYRFGLRKHGDEWFIELVSLNYDI